MEEVYNLEITLVAVVKPPLEVGHLTPSCNCFSFIPLSNLGCGPNMHITHSK